MSSHPNHIPVSLIGLPYHCGTRGAVLGNAMALGPEVLLADDKAPSLFRSAFTDVEVIWLDKADQATEEENGGDFRKIPAGDQMGRILVQNIHLSRAVREARAKGRIPIISAGTCSATFGVIGGLGDVEGNIGMVWFDAHGDSNTPDTTENGFIEGMLTTTIAGKCWPKYRRMVPGFREIDEERIISVSVHEPFSSNGRQDSSAPVGQVVDPPLIAKLGYAQALGQALDVLRSKTSRVFVHVDTDVLDPTILMANRHGAEGGLTDLQVIEGLWMIAERFEILAASFTSFDPNVDPRGPAVILPMMLEPAYCVTASRAT